MLRLLAGLLLAANLLAFAWIQGWMRPLLAPPMSSEREPERLAQQVRPETVELLGAQAADRARQAASAAAVTAAAASSTAAQSASAAASSASGAR